MLDTTTLQAHRLLAALDDHTTSAHSLRLVHLAQVTARQLQFSEADIYLSGLAALLHDIGKVNIPKSILEKPGRLTAEEWAVIHQHPTMGYDILMREGGIFARLAPIVLTHHERWDGRGYPLGLEGEAIPLEARILAVVDAYDAMTVERVYSPALTIPQACIELRRCAGSQFDPQVVSAFLAVRNLVPPQMLLQPMVSAPNIYR